MTDKKIGNLMFLSQPRYQPLVPIINI